MRASVNAATSVILVTALLALGPPSATARTVACDHQAHPLGFAAGVDAPSSLHNVALSRNGRVTATDSSDGGYVLATRGPLGELDWVSTSDGETLQAITRDITGDGRMLLDGPATYVYDEGELTALKVRPPDGSSDSYWRIAWDMNKTGIVAGEIGERPVVWNGLGAAPQFLALGEFEMGYATHVTRSGNLFGWLSNVEYDYYHPGGQPRVLEPTWHRVRWDRRTGEIVDSTQLANTVDWTYSHNDRVVGVDDGQAVESRDGEAYRLLPVPRGWIPSDVSSKGVAGRDGSVLGNDGVLHYPTGATRIQALTGDTAFGYGVDGRATVWTCVFSAPTTRT